LEETHVLYRLSKNIHTLDRVDAVIRLFPSLRAVRRIICSLLERMPAAMLTRQKLPGPNRARLFAHTMSSTDRSGGRRYMNSGSLAMPAYMAATYSP
jgi:hypothetical protein